MTPERQLEIKEIIEVVRKYGMVSHEVLLAMDEMMTTVGALGEAEYVLNIDATWKEKNKVIGDLKNKLDIERKWRKYACRFSFAHELNCPRHDKDVKCKCGLDEFLSNPIRYIEEQEKLKNST